MFKHRRWRLWLLICGIPALNILLVIIISFNKRQATDVHKVKSVPRDILAPQLRRLDDLDSQFNSRAINVRKNTRHADDDDDDDDDDNEEEVVVQEEAGLSDMRGEEEEAWIEISDTKVRNEDKYEDSEEVSEDSIWWSKREKSQPAKVLSHERVLLNGPMRNYNGVNQRGSHRKYNLTFWSQDYKLGLIHDLKYLLQPYGVSFVDKSLSPRCAVVKTCAKDLKVINFENGLNLSPNLIPKFYEAYKNDPEIRKVDAFICMYPASMCELFVPFNKSIIIIINKRYELGRFEESHWRRWNERLIEISKNNKHLLAASNQYDIEYVRYFTKLEPVLIPHHCGYVKDSYTPTNKEFLLYPIRKVGFGDRFIQDFHRALEEKAANVSIKLISDLYPGQVNEPSNLIRHPGIIYVPHQVSYLTLSEQYRMNIPMFFPSLELLTRWQAFAHVVMDRTWMGARSRLSQKSDIRGVVALPDPNNDKAIGSIGFWLQYSDFYIWPHITYYGSIGDLVEKLTKMTPEKLAQISMKMKMYNKKNKKSIANRWMDILDKLTKNKETK